MYRADKDVSDPELKTISHSGKITMPKELLGYAVIIVTLSSARRLIDHAVGLYFIYLLIFLSVDFFF